jgi:carbamoyl-phosphate synthase small subunit
MPAPRPARLALADGTLFEGFALGAPLPVDGAALGEVVFTTGMTGYQEVFTDPSYTGQIVTMTAPEIGNTGINGDDTESRDLRPQVRAIVVRHLSELRSNHRATEALDAWLTRHGVTALTEVDTRSLVRHLRDVGSQNGAIGEGGASTLVDRARSAPNMEGLDLVAQVTPEASYTVERGNQPEWRVLEAAASRPHVVALDLGAKQNILRSLVDAGCRVTVVPARTTAAEVLALSPDGVFVSNGPGDPAAVTYAIDTVRDLLGKKPLFGICLGHQLLSLAAGARTYKLKFGHRGLNQPVLDQTTGRVEITSQNHGFAVDLATLPKSARSTHIHLNDGTSEGLALPDAGAFSVQYHPEAAAGPHDTLHLFSRFVAAMAG